MRRHYLPDYVIKLLTRQKRSVQQCRGTLKQATENGGGVTALTYEGA